MWHIGLFFMVLNRVRRPRAFARCRLCGPFAQQAPLHEKVEEAASEAVYRYHCRHALSCPELVEQGGKGLAGRADAGIAKFHGPSFIGAKTSNQRKICTV